MPKFHRGEPGHLLKHCYKVAGIGESGLAGNVLDLQSGRCDQHLLGLPDPAGGQIFIGGTSEKSPEQAGEILRSNEYHPAQFFYGEAERVVSFDFPDYRIYIPLIEGILCGLFRGGSFCKIHKQPIAFNRQGGLVYRRSRVDNVNGSLTGVFLNMIDITYHLFRNIIFFSLTYHTSVCLFPL